MDVNIVALHHHSRISLRIADYFIKFFWGVKKKKLTKNVKVNFGLIKTKPQNMFWNYGFHNYCVHTCS